MIVQSLKKKNVFELRENELTIYEEIISKFKKTTNFENKVKLIIDYITRGGDINSESSQPMIDYFMEVLNAPSEPNERKFLSVIVLYYGNYEGIKIEEIDKSIVFGIKNMIDLYDNLEMDIKKSLLDILKIMLKDWDYKYVDLMLHTSVTKQHSYMLKQLAYREKFEVINSLIVSATNTFQENPELYTWLAKAIFEELTEELRTNLDLSEQEIIFRMLSLVDLLNSEIESKSNVGRNKKLLNMINDILFKKGLLGRFIEDADETISRSIVRILYSSTYLNEDVKNDFIDKITKKYPALKKVNKQEKVKMRHPFLVTGKSFGEKQTELSRIITVEIPENSRAIGEAMEKGDLRENAEYKAALEKQDQLKAMVSKLEKELNQAKIIEKSKVDTTEVDVGTKVTLLNEDTGEKMNYQILGQWDVDLKKNTISYHSPLGKAILEKKIGEEAEFEFDGNPKKFKILNIELADFS